MSFREDELILSYEEQAARYRAARDRMYKAGKPDAEKEAAPKFRMTITTKPDLSELAWIRQELTRVTQELTRVRQDLTRVQDELTKTRHRLTTFQDADMQTPEYVRYVRGIITLTANCADMTPTDICSSRRAYAKARHISMFLARKFTQASLPEIGRMFGGVFGAMDHTSVAYGIRKVELVVKKIGEPAENTVEAWARHLLSHDWPRVEYKGGGLKLMEHD